MKTKALMIGTVFVATGLILAGVSWAGSRIAYNQAKQHKRIITGVKKGTITGRELARLNREQWRIQKTIWRARSDGRLTPGERNHVSKLQHKASRHIYRAKHNGLGYYKRKPYYRHRHHWHKHKYYGYPYRDRYTYYGYPYKQRHTYYGYPYRHRHYHYGHHFKGRHYRPHYSFSFSMGWW